MLLYISFSGILSSALLWIYNAKKYPASKYLAIFFFLISLYSLNIYVLLHSKSVLANTWIATNFTFLYYSIGPVAYLYIRSIVKDSFSLSRKDLLHFIPSLLFLLATIPYYLTPYAHKVAIAEKIVADPQFLHLFKPTLFSQLFPVEWVYISRPLSMLVYALYSAYYLIRFLHLQKRDNTDLQFKLMVKWLKFFLLFYFLIIITHSLMMHQSFDAKNMAMFFSVNLLNYLFYAGFAGLTLTPFFFPVILYGLPQSPTKPEKERTIQTEDDEQENPNEPNDAKQLLRLDRDYISTIESRIEKMFTQEQPYRQPDFNLTKLSNIINIPAHHLSYYFREIKKQNFTDFRNEYRVNFAAALLVSDKHKELTLEAIGQMAGFSSRVSFFRSFKKVKGVSPGEYSASRQS